MRSCYNPISKIAYSEQECRLTGDMWKGISFSLKIAYLWDTSYKTNNYSP